MMKLFMAALLLIMAGCSSTQMREEFMWIDPTDVTSAKNKHVAVVNKAPAECFEKILSILNGMGAGITQKNAKKYFLVADRFDGAFKTAVNTTQVGIVVTPAKDGKSQIEVASGNDYLAGFVSNALFQQMENPDKKPEEVLVRAKKAEDVK